MKKISIADTIAYPITLGVGYFLRKLPIRPALKIGRFVGKLIYFVYTKRRRIAYANLKAAFGSHTKPKELRRLTKEVFCRLAETGVEVLRLPDVDKEYVKEYIKQEGLENIDKALENGKGAIILTAHFGNWELSSLAGALSGYPQDVFVRAQKHSKLNELLNNYRMLGGRHVITKGVGTKQIIKTLRENRVVSILTDQDGGQSGYLVEFFGRLASTPAGAISFALRMGSKVLPHFIIRQKGPSHTSVVEPAMELHHQQDKEIDIQKNLQQFTNVLADYITKYPTNWLWLHKRWKTSPSRKVLILNDGKAGHLNQSLAIASQVHKRVMAKCSADPRIDLLRRAKEEEVTDSYDSPSAKPHRLDELIYSQRVVNVKFKNRFFRHLLNICSFFASPRCQGCMRCVKICLDKDSYRKLVFNYTDVVISAGSSLAGLNKFLGIENNAKAVVAMKPGILPVSRFDLAVIPQHDSPRRSKNTVITDGAANLTGADNSQNGANGAKRPDLDLHKGPVIGLLLGGDNKRFRLTVDIARRILDDAIKLTEKLDGQLLVTTSRRTSQEVEAIVEEKLKSYSRCKKLVLANRKNPPDTVSSILDNSQILIISAESISMISEAASCGNKLVMAFEMEPNKSGMRTILRIFRDRHRAFLKNLMAKNYIVLVEPKELAGVAYELWQKGKSTQKLNDTKLIYEAIEQKAIA